MGPPLHQPFWKTSEPQIWGKTPTGHRWPWKRSTPKKAGSPPKKEKVNPWSLCKLSRYFWQKHGNCSENHENPSIFSPGCSKVAPHFFSCWVSSKEKKHTENFEAFYISPTYATCWGYTFWTLPTPGSWFWNLIRCSTHAWLIHVGSTSPTRECRKRSA